MKLKFGIKEVVAIGIGTALFVAMTEFQIPSPIPNTYLQPRMAVMAFLAAVFGPIVGGAVGLLGHAIGDAVFYSSVWWSWVFPEGVLGIAIGLFAVKFAVKSGGFNSVNCNNKIKKLKVCANCTNKSMLFSLMKRKSHAFVVYFV